MSTNAWDQSTVDIPRAGHLSDEPRVGGEGGKKGKSETDKRKQPPGSEGQRDRSGTDSYKNNSQTINKTDKCADRRTKQTAADELSQKKERKEERWKRKRKNRARRTDKIGPDRPIAIAARL